MKNRHDYSRDEWDVASRLNDNDNKGMDHGYTAVRVTEVEHVEEKPRASSTHTEQGKLPPTMNLRVNNPPRSSSSSPSSRLKVVSKKMADSLKVHWVYKGKRLKLLM